MPIGNSKYEPPTYDQEKEKQIKLQDEIADDWETCGNKEEIMEDYYPDKVGLEDVEDLYNGLSQDQKLEIYMDRNPEKIMRPEDYPR